MLVTVSFTIPHGTCSSTTVGRPQLPTPDLTKSVKLAALQLLPNYKSHEALQD
ncbi:unnamed protein product [Staurois parvus]|uniref:Uncharacterized protein n=1 Tax=Staurois parvus TaxID=386267 RepID=A0ABN9GS97_9NEOB|nr:unnamed protein product [Staurois parvus]